MDPITLHFNIFQAGVATDGRKSMEVTDPHSMTVGSLKKKCFFGELEEQKSVRFIAGGRILEDAVPLERCKLGKEAHIHVSIGAAASDSSPNTAPSPKARTGPHSYSADQDTAAPAGFTASALARVFGILVLFVVTGSALSFAWARRRHLSMRASQVGFILASLWAYCLLCHGIPHVCKTIGQALKKKAT